MHLHGVPQLVVAKDGLPLDSPYAADTILIGPGERYTVLIHADAVGTWVWHCHILNHVESSDGMFGMVSALVVA
jgi:FtsP/CotA-like multicopper oxidase with cupredoxin domain